MSRRALKLVPEGICPTCRQRIRKGPARTCAACGKPILRHDKFYFSGSTIQHKDCNNPGLYPPDPAP